MKPCLPAMHLKAHSWHCQVINTKIHVCHNYVVNCILKILWGGHWQDGAGSGSGEDMELLFSYLSQWAFPTRNVLAYTVLTNTLCMHLCYALDLFLGREEFLSEAVVFWNDRKIQSLPKMLVHHLQKVHKQLCI